MALRIGNALLELLLEIIAVGKAGQWIEAGLKTDGMQRKAQAPLSQDQHRESGNNKCGDG
ncbi:hypothetical protein [Pseudidiomarina terrestris]|uniref:Uncharacterized protein n=1 Tax=Pseudidiomarina terrestris TaxID=2820060 RepID=A0AAW7QVP7_9GAMM|nr:MULTISPECIES: hypothetical protein [unclassified Pseudidiomarina]MDN7124325.1 hypothetical protein [Pseudidiomarina sp. 1APP75-32.1]MDN7129384.1 hypothetical protein [Pseudidiomarina sp. 1APR75-15]MDN7134351.1 hypothetical protein [Pseudidiomarina sp. 1ASP75-5]